MGISVNVRCSSGTKFTVETEVEISVLEFKQKLVQESSVPVEQQRLVYKGRILKDDKTLKDYDVEADTTVHLVKGSAQAAQASASAAPSGPTASTSSSATGGPAGAQGAWSGLGMPFGGGGMQDLGSMQQQLMQNPDMLRQIMDSPMMQSVMSNPDIIRTMLTSNPQMRTLLESNPQLNHLLNDPEMLRRTMEAMRNPAAMREMMRNQDRALNNLESHPEGFNALRRIYQDVQEPLMEAASDSASMLSTSNPQSNTGSTNQSATSAGPTNSPMPNPWASGNTSASPAPQATSPANPFAPSSMGLGLNPSQMSSMMSPDQMTQMLQNPLVQNMLQQMLSNPQWLQQMEAMDPNFASFLNANPQMRQQMQNPDFVRAVSDPNNIQAIMQIRQAMNQLSGSGLMSSSMTNLGQLGAGSTAGATPASGVPPAFDMNSIFHGMLSGNSPTASADVQDSATRYATQLQQLEEMGFTNREQNLRALNQTSGNINAAVERILGGQV